MNLEGVGATKGTLQVDHPGLPVQWPQPGGEDLGLSEELQVSFEAELAILESLLERAELSVRAGQCFHSRDLPALGLNGEREA